MYNRSNRSLFEEIDSFIPTKNKDEIIKARAVNLIETAINFIKLIEDKYDDTEAEELTTKLLLAMKRKDTKKFISKINSLESKGKNK